MDEVIETVRKTIRKNRLLQKGETVIATVSGGCDSVFLLRSLFLLRDDFRIELKVAHLNHMLREEEAERDAEFVKGLCRELSVDCHLESRDVKAFAEKHSLSLEEGARMCRYDFFESVRQNTAADKIALGHTADDQAETLLLRLFRETLFNFKFQNPNMKRIFLKLCI